MRVKINRRYATVEDTAKALGVPRDRAIELTRLFDSYGQLKKSGLSVSRALRAARERVSAADTFIVDVAGRNGSGKSSNVNGTKNLPASKKKRSRAKVSKKTR
jgi:hypothetical protein